MSRAEERRRSRRRWVFSLVGILLLAVVLGGSLYRVPYVALLPGSARDAGTLIEVEGTESYPSDGELLLTTVQFRQRPNFWEYLWLQTDDDAEILPEDVVLGDRTPDENREFNLSLMNDSKAVAIAVALEQLGYDAIRSNGVVIIEIVDGGAAEGVLEPGDSVTAIDSEPVVTTNDLVAILEAHAPGDEIVLTIEPVPDGAVPNTDAPTRPTTEQVSVVLGARPADESDEESDDAFLGVGPTDRVELNEDFGFEIDIDTGTVGGPSAGLAFTLAILDVLTDGELTGGTEVAVTGTIDVGGNVGPVGGIAQKAAVVRDLGIDTFIVPAGLPESEMDKILASAGDELDIIPVANIDEALEALAGLGGEVGAVEEFAASNPAAAS